MSEVDDGLLDLALVTWLLYGEHVAFRFCKIWISVPQSGFGLGLGHNGVYLLL